MPRYGFPASNLFCLRSSLLICHIAKVILNRRKDVAAWDRSFRSTILQNLPNSWSLKAFSFFSPDYFWLRQILLRFVIDFFDGSFEKHGVDVYRAYYRKLEDKVGQGKYLEWSVEDGWYVFCSVPSSALIIACLGTLIGADCRKGALYAPSLTNRSRTRLSRVAMQRLRLRSALRRGEQRISNTRVSMWQRR